MEAKPKRQLTQAQLDQLAKAREKANAVRKRNAEMKKKEKKMKKKFYSYKILKNHHYQRELWRIY